MLSIKNGLTVTLTAFIMAMLSASVCNAEPVQKELHQKVSEFTRLLKKDYTPTLADYQTFYGYTDADELALQWKQCETKGWVPPLQSHECHQQMLQSWAKKDETPSLYLAWLRKRLPLDPKVTIKSVKPVGGMGQAPGERITVQLNDDEVVLWRPIKVEEATVLGRISAVEINGVPISKLRQQDANASVLIALGLTTLVRPLTEAELAAKEKEQKARCAADPDCVKRRTEHEAQEKEHEKEQAVRTQVSKNYQIWCETNPMVCEKQQADREKLLEQRNSLQTKCDENYKGCLAGVEQWLGAQQAAQKAFCNSSPDDCAALDAIRLKKDEQQKAWCADNPETCAKSMTDFDKAVMEVRASLSR